MIRRRAAFAQESESSEDEEDAFAALSRKKSKRPKPSSTEVPVPKKETAEPPKPSASLPLTTTSSMRRHHLPDDMRKAKMDALLDELKADTKQMQNDPGDRRGDRFVPDKKGSFVEPGEEHLTTNIFVGNLSPSITEEKLTDLFSQFGDLYSVKIMWPRNPTERSRGRHTGFVCFMNRDDAEEAMDSCSERDPFNVGRLLMLRWGKNVKKTVRRGTAIAPIRKKTPMNPEFSNNGGSRSQDSEINSGEPDQTNEKAAADLRATPNAFKLTTYQPEIDGKNAIRVEMPADRSRLEIITAAASFVATDGHAFEQRLIQSKFGDPAFKFLVRSDSDNEIQKKEHIFYRWRVYSFCQGDKQFVWKTDPFVMFHPNGKWWIPPPLDEEAARQEELGERLQEESKMKQKKDLRRNIGRRGFLTGRQIERSFRRSGPNVDGSAKLSRPEREQFDKLVKRQLTISRSSICEAMAFCFENCWAAKDISSMLKQALMEEGLLITIDTRVARLYLLSDILFNSQQPGIRNAFMYRSAIEDMAPEVFRSLGKHGGGTVGRLTMNKLRNAVSSVLSAWTEWSVYSPTFMDELEAYFEGREIVKPEERHHEAENKSQPESKLEDEAAPVIIQPVEVSAEKQMSIWEDVAPEGPKKNKKKRAKSEPLDKLPESADTNPHASSEQNRTVSDSANVDDIGNSESKKSATSRRFGDENDDGSFDGHSIGDSDIDGESLGSHDIDGDSLNSDL